MLGLTAPLEGEGIGVLIEPGGLGVKVGRLLGITVTNTVFVTVSVTVAGGGKGTGGLEVRGEGVG